MTIINAKALSRKEEMNFFALWRYNFTQCRSACTVQQARVSGAKNLYDCFRDPSLLLRESRLAA